MAKSWITAESLEVESLRAESLKAECRCHPHGGWTMFGVCSVFFKTIKLGLI